MAKNQQLDPRDYDAAKAEKSDNVAPTNKFVLVEEEEKALLPPLITAEEQERRDLRARFKKVHGYKPIIKDLKELRRAVDQAEQRMRTSI